LSLVREDSRAAGKRVPHRQGESRTLDSEP